VVKSKGRKSSSDSDVEKEIVEMRRKNAFDDFTLWVKHSAYGRRFRDSVSPEFFFSYVDRLLGRWYGDFSTMNPESVASAYKTFDPAMVYQAWWALRARSYFDSHMDRLFNKVVEVAREAFMNYVVTCTFLERFVSDLQNALPDARAVADVLRSYAERMRLYDISFYLDGGVLVVPVSFLSGEEDGYLIVTKGGYDIVWSDERGERWDLYMTIREVLRSSRMQSGVPLLYLVRVDSSLDREVYEGLRRVLGALRSEKLSEKLAGFSFEKYLWKLGKRWLAYKACLIFPERYCQVLIGIAHEFHRTGRLSSRKYYFIVRLLWKMVDEIEKSREKELEELLKCCDEEEEGEGDGDEDEE